MGLIVSFCCVRLQQPSSPRVKSEVKGISSPQTLEAKIYSVQSYFSVFVEELTDGNMSIKQRNRQMEKDRGYVY